MSIDVQLSLSAAAFIPDIVSGMTDSILPAGGPAGTADLPGRLHFTVASLACFALALLHVGGPFDWLGTWLHEISHGLAAIATGGDIIDITLNFDGSGEARSRGGNETLTTFSGYAGAPILAGLLYLAASLRGRASRFALTIAAAATSAAVLWYGRTFATYAIGGAITALLAMIVVLGQYVQRWRPQAGMRLGQYAALLVIIQETIAPLGLIVGGLEGDARHMAALTWIPAIVWALVWSVIGGGVFVFVARHGVRRPLPASSAQVR